MTIHDSIYGEHNIDDVLAELLQSKAVQRLQKIHQGGASFLVNPMWNVTRYEHSAGVMLLVKMLGGSIEEQIAALLHDVSHTAFSHIVDHVLEEQDEDYHEQIFMDVIEASDIPSILQKYGYDYRMIEKWEQWTLLEQPLPNLCADRIDYTLRDLHTYGMISKQEVSSFLEDITVHDGQICIQSVQAAEWFTDAYYKETINFFLHPLNSYGYYRLTEVLKYALQRNILHLSDFSTDDETVLHLLRNCGDCVMDKMLSSLHSKVVLEESDTEYDICYKGGKERLIDPPIYINGKTQRASVVSSFVKQCNEKAKKQLQQNIYLKIKSV
ncbi:HD domain-containing protein [Bacillus sp. BP-3]|uniref:HD domain-containing protein n=1 Tax=Bacillus sp. BP-3 TaxID=3022773 RepID=UPI00232ECA70|nr:HD domain-containing protein [Bacillus sp. BP-3]MDC2863420.1 HD domain-containing protein [Bacillus sp. BP-3]